jgi:hypothetical protein
MQKRSLNSVGVGDKSINEENLQKLEGMSPEEIR